MYATVASGQENGVAASREKRREKEDKKVSGTFYRP
jgi:hypothetical protein